MYRAPGSIYCSGHLWTYDGWSETDIIGVVFDLPESCGIPAGQNMRCEMLWWYWRCTVPNRSYTIQYGIVEIDSSQRLSGNTVWESEWTDPIERWNTLSVGVEVPDRFEITATWNRCCYPRPVTDSNVANQQANCMPVHDVTHSFFFGNAYYNTVYCPPLPFTDPLGPVELLADAGFDAVVSTENTSWGAIKALFK